ncbi:nuclear transport factor 2 family protein [Nakamurella sp. PAMC28650]|uniref:nuclear transport factor 2 family protein n=1 Tax=Nakamurella sp. PAMC28650 TaxID=2762325 RepID=UPI00164CEABF|nr:nuclear transport factor 2 family protein [Nakamurella sp. PAMC28650]QNK79500.1 nuclear transport factor 2 family protein [Nakamurella sp. PAMC28650]
MGDDADELQMLVDKSRITELLTRYLRAIDRADVATLRACYLPGATEEHGGMYRGPAQGYIDLIQEALCHPRSVGTHALSNVVIDLAGDRAVSEHYVLALTRVKVDGVVTDHLVSTRIVDDLQRRDGRWLIGRRRLRFDWSRELGPRPTLWLGGRLDPSKLLHSGKFPDDPIYDTPDAGVVGVGSAPGGSRQIGVDA